MPKVSVAIPSYNASETIAATLRSVLDSAFGDLEIVINDDASTDETLQNVRAVDDPRIRWYRNPETLGPAANWNRAISKASGEFIGLLNHDDLYGPFWLSFAVHALETHPTIGWAATAFRIIDEAGNVKGAISRFEETGRVDRQTAFLQIARLDGLGPAYLARRQVIEAVGGYDEEIGASADNDLFLRLAAHYPLYYSSNP
ncbi:MAG: glycosyltransferase, partial [Anaerolineae bacterium]